uniref:Uncharacterized protein n=1 Tax=Mycena chlorophos TaxID=658473 RepID=A0ABQ0MAZ2_MYCCL|nr:predicted protein [Mycena chlorophos]
MALRWWLTSVGGRRPSRYSGTWFVGSLLYASPSRPVGRIRRRVLKRPCSRHRNTVYCHVFAIGQRNVTNFLRNSPEDIAALRTSEYRTLCLKNALDGYAFFGEERMASPEEQMIETFARVYAEHARVGPEAWFVKGFTDTRIE